MSADEPPGVAGMTVAEFLDGVAARQVAPSAGAVTAVTAATGAALCEMVAIHTADPPARLGTARETLAAERDRLLSLADEDAAAVDRVQTAFEADTEETHPQAALRRATEAPLSIALACADALEAAVVVAEDGTRNAVVDVVVGARVLRTALDGAATIVRANLGMVEDETFTAGARDSLDEAETAAAAAVDRVTDATDV